MLCTILCYFVLNIKLSGTIDFVKIERNNTLIFVKNRHIFTTDFVKCL
ncbi:hypothetical protein HMPREF1575_00739 [Gardnerella vaginalis JCP7672]|nr:hypothetical protein HMPREF1575_00739 [Gardnerella vaginalis JCP7672]